MLSGWKLGTCVGIVSCLVLVAPVAQVSGKSIASPTYRAYDTGLQGGEPSIGYDKANDVALYGSGLSVLRMAWDEKGKMAKTDVTPTTGGLTSLDAITAVDSTTGRAFSSQLAGGCSVVSYTDNAGASWTPSQGCGVNTLLDHQSLAAGPFHAPLSALSPYPNAVYYCAQNGFNNSCAVSLDGGLTFGPGVYTSNTPINDQNDPNPTFAAEGGACVGLHGHLKVGPDGTAYLPLKGCGGQPTLQNGTNYEYWGGRPALSISQDGGFTWNIDMMPDIAVPDGLGGQNHVSTVDESDTTVSIASGGAVYYAWENGTDTSDITNATRRQAFVAVSHDNGATWPQVVDVSSALGVNNVMFPVVVAGDNDRATLAFLGTKAIGDDQTTLFPTDPPWYLYMSTTYDGGKHWTTVSPLPNDPIQRGCIDMQGITIPPTQRVNVCGGDQRNMLDFNDATIDKQGRVLLAFTQGCDRKCAATPNKTSAGGSAVDKNGNVMDNEEMVLRQTGGLTLFASQDPAEAGAPAAGVIGAQTSVLPNTSSGTGQPWPIPLALVIVITMVTGLLVRRRRSTAG